ncbi:MAG: response regulator transcription factor [Firmicutes bacterium]|jgi:DNA-binding response OmpR family regulator|nr:response regulator transcription factor [Bacillota bacterium]
MESVRILVIDDEEAIGNVIKDYLEAQGYEVFWAEDGLSAIDMFQRINPDLIILDLMLPGKSGFDVCKELRKDSNVPVIMLTAKSDEIDRVLGLELGADDYVTKPFSLRELAARVKAVLRRVGKGVEDQRDVLKVGDIAVDVEGHQVTVSGREVALTPTEFSILLFLAERPGRVASRLQLVNASLGEAYVGYERSIDTHVSNLRKKIEDDPANPKRLQTVYGVGYKLVP